MTFPELSVKVTRYIGYFLYPITASIFMCNPYNDFESFKWQINKWAGKGNTF